MLVCKEYRKEFCGTLKLDFTWADSDQFDSTLLYMCARYQCFLVIKTLSVSWRKYSTLPSNSFLTFYVINYTSLMVSQIVIFMIFTWQTRKGQLRISLLLISFWCGALVWLVVSLTSPRWPSDLCPESSTGERKVRQVWVLFSRVPSLVPSVHKRSICFFSQTSVTRVRSSYTSLRAWVWNRENPRSSVQVMRDRESSRNENRWIFCGLLARLFESVACFAWIPSAEKMHVKYSFEINDRSVSDVFKIKTTSQIALAHFNSLYVALDKRKCKCIVIH